MPTRLAEPTAFSSSWGRVSALPGLSSQGVWSPPALREQCLLDCAQDSTGPDYNPVGPSQRSQEHTFKTGSAGRRGQDTPLSGIPADFMCKIRGPEPVYFWKSRLASLGTTRPPEATGPLRPTQHCSPVGALYGKGPQATGQGVCCSVGAWRRLRAWLGPRPPLCTFPQRQMESPQAKSSDRLR